jgi:hypothetical protein
VKEVIPGEKADIPQMIYVLFKYKSGDATFFGHMLRTTIRSPKMRMF